MYSRWVLSTLMWLLGQRRCEEAGARKAADDPRVQQTAGGWDEGKSVQIPQALGSRRRPWAYPMKRFLAGLPLLGRA